MARGVMAQKRRRARRERLRNLTAGAQGGNFPLGDRAEAWDAGASTGQYQLPRDGNHYMWRDPNGDPATKSAYKLPFVSGDHAVWKAITSIAGILQGGRGGVSIPQSDQASIKRKIEAYYAKARVKYNDDNIQVPWKSSAAVEIDYSALAESIAYAERGEMESDDYHLRVLSLIGEFADTMPCDNCDHAASMHAGPENDGACSVAQCSCMAYEAPPQDSDDDSGPNEQESPQVDESAGEAEVLDLDQVINLAMDLAIANGQRLTFVLRDFEPETATADNQPLFTGGARWTATLCPEGKATEDGRIFAPDSITWRELPLSLMGMIETQQGHDGAQVCGRIDQIWREDATGLIRGSGEFDTGEYGQLIARMVGDETLRGLSVDIAPVKVEVAKRTDVVDEDGNWIEEAASEDSDEEEAEPAERPSLVEILFGDDDMITVVREGVIGAATVCPFPAFADATIEIANIAAADRAGMIWTVQSQAGWIVTAIKQPKAESAEEEVEALTASAAGIAPVSPPPSWFEDPALPELTPLTVEDDGRIYGHAAAWGTCHTGIPGTCTTAPTSETDYAYFHLKEVACDDGSRVAVGTITMDAGHADLELGRAAATDHYDNTAVAAADVRVGEDEHGIWVAGCIRPDLDEMSARRLRGATVSGDWRSVRLSDGTANRELIALLAVNVPGFPVPRPQALVASSGEGELLITAQVAAGMHAGQEGLTLLQKRQAEATAMSDEFAEMGRAFAS